MVEQCIVVEGAALLWCENQSSQSSYCQRLVRQAVYSTVQLVKQQGVVQSPERSNHYALQLMMS